MTAPGEDDLDEAPAPLDPTRYARPARSFGLREIDGLPVRVVERLPESTLRDSLPFVTSLVDY